MDKKINLSKEKTKDLIEEIKDHFLKERDEELGDLGASIILDFIVEKIAPAFYDQGIADAYKYLNERISDVLLLQKLPEE